MKYKWKRRPSGAPTADITGKYIEGIKEKRKGITPQLLVVEASKKRSPLHGCFEWDNDKAADGHRREQARLILRMLMVVIEIEEQSEIGEVRAFVSPQELELENQTSYVFIEQVRGDDVLDAAYTHQLYRELNSIKMKIKNYKIFAGVVKAIEKVKI